VLSFDQKKNHAKSIKSFHTTLREKLDEDFEGKKVDQRFRIEVYENKEEDPSSLSLTWSERKKEREKKRHITPKGKPLTWS
jgi:hypothetical protein